MTYYRMIDNPELDEAGEVDISKREIGDMWHVLTSVMMLLPGRNYFLVDGKVHEFFSRHL